MDPGRLTIVSPLPPSRSGIADYCHEQLAHLGRSWDVTVVIADDAPSPVDVPAGVRVVRRQVWRGSPDADRDGLRLYHLGNNPHHEHVLLEARERPGVVVLHDFVLHHLARSMTLARNEPAAYRQLLVDELGPGAGEVLFRQEQLGLYTERIAHSFPLNDRLLAASLGVIVHSTASLERIRQRHPTLPAVRIPHHYSPPPVTVGNRDEARRRLGVDAQRLVVTTMGYVTPPKQVDLLFAAVAALRDELPPLEVWVAGEAADDADLAARAAALGLHDVVRYTGFLSTEDFYRHIAASDVIVNLRYPSAGETSGTLVRALGLGACAVVFDFDSFADYPDGAVIKIPLDTCRPDPLVAALRGALSDPDRRAATAAAAARHVRTVHGLEPYVAPYTEFLRAVAGGGLSTSVRAMRAHSAGANRVTLDRHRPALGRTETATTVDDLIARIDVAEFGLASVSYARTHRLRWVETLATVPAGGPGSAALELGSYQVVLPFLRHAAGFDYVAGADRGPGGPPHRIDRWLDGPHGRDRYDLFLFDAESDRFPFDDRSFDLVLACEIIEHLTRDPMFMLSEINRILRFGGLLVLTTPNIASARGVAAMLGGHSPYLYPNYNRDRSTDRHNIEYSVHQVAALLRGAGFGDLSLRTPDCWGERPAAVMSLLEAAGHPADLRGDVVLATAVKASEIVDRYPAEAYGPGPPVRRLSTWPLDGP